MFIQYKIKLVQKIHNQARTNVNSLVVQHPMILTGPNLSKYNS